MADNLPLLPEKCVSTCADVRCVLREVFRELDYCAPAADRAQHDATDTGPTSGDCWTKESSADHNKLHQQEWELQKEYAKRLSREPLPNIYQLHSPAASVGDVNKKNERIILRRNDLKPSVDQDAGGDQSLWVQNILNRSSGDLGALKVVGSRVHLPVTLEAAELDTVQSFSIGDLLPRASLPPTPPAPQPPEPTYIMCIPPSLDFVNFNVGRLHTRSIRLVNVSKFELRLSVRPPARRELDVELCSRLAVTSGAAAELRVHFRASDVRALADELVVRVSTGRALSVPISCYMEPPQLHITIPNAPMLCVSAAHGGVSQHTHTVELGVRLVGDVHRVPLLLRCVATHAGFFLVSDDSWTHCNLQVTAGTSRTRGIPTDCFYVSPARWAGGGATRGLAICRAPGPGLHTAALRVVSSTAIVRPLSFIADAMLYSPDHVTIQAHEKDYDICSEDDPGCQYYVNLGMAFPNRSLATTITIINNSPLVYHYYWSVRAWGACSCWQDFLLLPPAEREDDALCAGAREARDITLQGGEPLRAETEEARQLVRVSAASGCLCPRSETAARVCVPDVGALLYTRRAVLMLILKNVPEESFPANYDPMTVKTTEIEEKCIPGVCPKWSRSVCDVVCAQLEVWWRVVPVRFALHPPLLLLPYSRRVKSAALSLRSTQLYGDSSITAKWRHLSPAPPPLVLPPQQSVLSTVVLPLHELPNQFPHSHVIELVAESEEWSSSCRIERWCSTRHPALRPAAVWLGVQPPGAPVAAQLTVLNDTHQHICWWATVHRWWRARGPAGPCATRAPCAACCSRACACDALSPARGALDHAQSIQLRYCVNAPDSDGCVATVVQLQRTAADVARVCSGRGVDARATLLAYRVLAPRLVLRVLPCRGDKTRGCEGCALDSDSSVLGGSPVLRPRSALSLADRSCCRLQITNTTPLPTTVQWSPAIEGEDILAVTFIPNEFKVGGHSTVEILAVLEARRTHARRLWVREARVAHAYKPLYLVIDAAISGVEVVVEFPIGGEENTDSFVKIPMTQPELPSRGKLTVEQMFAQDDCKRALQRENICHCHYKMIYIPPAPPALTAPPAPSALAAEERGEYSPVSILEEPPPLTRVCPCSGSTKPVLPEDTEPYCLQFRRLPIRTVRSRTLVLHNVSRLDAHWTAAVRRWPRKHDRSIDTAPAAQWARGVHASGAALQCEPQGGRLPPHGRAPVAVSVYADCWGLYRDQILIQVEGLSPLVLDVWVEAEGAPLEFPLRPVHPALTTHHPPVLWISSSDAERVVRIANTSRADLTTDVYLLRENKYPQDELPFRLYLRFFDVPPRICPCVTAFESNNKLEDESPRSDSSVYKEMDTDIEIYLGPDYGVQSTEGFYQVEPQRLCVRAGESAALTVRLRRQQQLVPHHVLLLRSTPCTRAGAGWFRAPPLPQLLQLRQAQRVPLLQTLSTELRVTICALHLPDNDVLRVRKKFRIQNIGEGPLEAVAATEAPWRVEFSRDVCAAHCVQVDRSHLFEDLQLKLAPRTSMELFAEVSLKAEDLWPTPGDTYPPRVTTTTSLNFYDHDKVLLLLMQHQGHHEALTIRSGWDGCSNHLFITSCTAPSAPQSLPLILELELPVLHVEPAILDFGFVSDGSSRKAYFTVSHSSLSGVDLVTQWDGAAQFRLYPPLFSLRAGASARVYVQYTARWEAEHFSEGAACVSACGAARAWCRARVRVTARAARPRALHAPAHVDHTDDPHLLPRDTC